MVDNALSAVTIVQTPINATKCLVLVTMDVKRVGMAHTPLLRLHVVKQLEHRESHF
jgi:hypothetical protein